MPRVKCSDVTLQQSSEQIYSNHSAMAKKQVKYTSHMYWITSNTQLYSGTPIFNQHAEAVEQYPRMMCKTLKHLENATASTNCDYTACQQNQRCSLNWRGQFLLDVLCSQEKNMFLNECLWANIRLSHHTPCQIKSLTGKQLVFQRQPNSQSARQHNDVTANDSWQTRQPDCWAHIDGAEERKWCSVMYNTLVRPQADLFIYSFLPDSICNPILGPW